ncbi:hypothetical protein B0H14DRAFT_3485402 [Mycena olivaceomarginata]|nr:hypothetical protein B0H14DRAFT_3485402 [Mycena olivaceomarginata]
MQRLWKLSKEPGFTASLARGVGVSMETRVPDSHHTSEEMCGDVDMPDALQAPQHVLEEEDESDMDAIVEAFDNIVRITHDATAAASSDLIVWTCILCNAACTFDFFFNPSQLCSEAAALSRQLMAVDDAGPGT